MAAWQGIPPTWYQDWNEIDRLLLWDSIQLGFGQNDMFHLLWFFPTALFFISAMATLTIPQNARDAAYGGIFLGLLLSFLEMPSEIAVFVIFLVLGGFLLLEHKFKWILPKPIKKYERL